MTNEDLLDFTGLKKELMQRIMQRENVFIIFIRSILDKEIKEKCVRAMTNVQS